MKKLIDELIIARDNATLTEALCNKLIFDLENGVVTVEEVNK